jgi:uncharacterized membrane protein
MSPFVRAGEIAVLFGIVFVFAVMICGLFGVLLKTNLETRGKAYFFWLCVLALTLVLFGVLYRVLS